MTDRKIEDMEIYYYDSADFDGSSPLDKRALSNTILDIIKKLAISAKLIDEPEDISQQDKITAELMLEMYGSDLGFEDFNTTYRLVLQDRLREALALGACIVMHYDARIRDQYGTSDIASWASIGLTDGDQGIRKKFEYLASIGFISFISRRQEEYEAALKEDQPST